MEVLLNRVKDQTGDKTKTMISKYSCHNNNYENVTEYYTLPSLIFYKSG